MQVLSFMLSVCHVLLISSDTPLAARHRELFNAALMCRPRVRQRLAFARQSPAFHYAQAALMRQQFPHLRREIVRFSILTFSITSITSIFSHCSPTAYRRYCSCSKKCAPLNRAPPKKLAMPEDSRHYSNRHLTTKLPVRLFY